jgi:hypothetical protein
MLRLSTLIFFRRGGLYHWPLLGLVGLVLGACVGQAPDRGQTGAYYDLVGLVNEQVADLTQSRATATKYSQTNGVAEEQTKLAVDWAQELALFAKADLNKPVLRDAYTAEVGPNVLTYTAKDAKLAVRMVRIYGPKASPDSIWVEVSEANSLYQAQREMQLVFAHQRLTNYRIRGYQQMLLSDTLHYTVAGRVEP